MSLKSWWNSLWEGKQDKNTGNFTQSTGECKQEKKISEPVLTLVRLFQKDPKRFKFYYEIDYTDSYEHHFYSEMRAYSYTTCTDIATKEQWKFELKFRSEAVDDSYFTYTRAFARHKVYPVLAYSIDSKPNWLTEAELVYIQEVLDRYFIDRVNRYREIVNYRKERTEESHKRKTELDKKKERQRLVDIYKGE